MRKWMEKWGSAAGALACVLVILFAVVYTRQDDIRRLSAQNAAADQSQTLKSAQEAPAVFRPVKGQLLQPFAGAKQSSSGLWTLYPYTHYQAAAHQEAYAILNGTCTSATAESLVISHENDLIARYSGVFVPEVTTGQAVTAGQRIARITTGPLRFSLSQGGHYIDPEAFFLSFSAK